MNSNTNDPSRANMTSSTSSPTSQISMTGTGKVKLLHQYYRDCLSDTYDFPNTGEISADIVQWVTNSSNTDFTGLAEYMQRTPTSKELSTEHDLALRLMLFTIMQANLATDSNNRFTDRLFPQNLADNIKRGITRILSLHPHEAYLINSLKVLYRTNQIDEVINLLVEHPKIVEKYPVAEAIAGFIYMIIGNYTESMRHLWPLVIHKMNRNLPLVALSFMTCQYFLKQPVDWPLTFRSLDPGPKGLQHLIEQIPLIEMTEPLAKETSTPIIFIACNDTYFFQHALLLAYSIHESNPSKLALHLHLYSPNSSVISEIEALRQRVPNLNIGVSVEFGQTPFNTPAYYAAARFIRAYQMLKNYKCELCVLDADALFINSWDTFTAHLTPHSEIALACPRAAPFWESVIAGFVYCKPTPKAQTFLAKVSEFILQNMVEGKNIWFTDQIALSACNDNYLSNDSSVEHIDCAILADIHHNPDALTWCVTTTKTGHLRYDRARESLGNKYGQLPQSAPDYILNLIGESNNSIFFLQIGAMDGVSFDPIHPYVKRFGWHGILVEPLPDMMERLKHNYINHPGLIFENIAITEKEELRSIYRIPLDTAREAGLPAWVLGMSTLVPGKLEQFGAYVIKQAVSCIPLINLIEKYQPQRIDVLQIDTEGYDLKILNQFDFERFKPLVVNFEAINLSQNDKDEAMNLLTHHNYCCYQNDMDIFAIRRDVLFQQSCA